MRALRVIGDPLELWLAMQVLESTELVDPQPRIPPEQKKLRRQVQRAIPPLQQLTKLLRELRGNVAVTVTVEAALRSLESLLRAMPATPKPGPAPHCVDTWLNVQARLRADGLTFGQIADIILSSNDDWWIRPCEALADRYGYGVDANGNSGREQLVDRLKKLGTPR